MRSTGNLKFAFLLLLLVAVAAFIAACGGSKANVRKEEAAANTPPPAVEVTTAAAIKRDLPRFFEATGSLAGDQQTDVAPQTSGKVVAVGVDIGSPVRRGQMLVRLDDAELKLRVEQAAAQVQQAKAAVRQAEEKIGLRPGQAFDPNRVAEVAAAKVTLDLAEKNLRRAEKLIESGDVSRQFYDQQRAQRDQLKEQYDVALAQARQNYAGVDVARTNVANAEAALALAKQNLSYAVIPSPMDGFVSERTADLGEYVSPQQKVATVVRTNPLRVRIDVPEQAIQEVRVGQSVSATTSAWPDRNFAGRVARIAPNVSAQSRTLTVEAEIDNGSGALKPGQFATVRILQERSEPAVLVPSRAVITEAGVSRVFVIKDGHAEQRLVQTGQTEGDLIEIRQGVAADEQVATSNQQQLSDGVAVKQ
ncbi:MAG TPA: efflux RND transporter periplasmic adaptor subunit [Pyrinomonadaceae bacterium]|jgi:multidrug efflux pump subunit AcrA (membrane-fusion protein)|nr:efflux RND transporter periplasmic adaptor subunit [Pyrinomonadaceae bacterium]